MMRNACAEDVSRLAEIHVCGWRHAYRGLVPDRELFVDRQVAKGMRMWEGIIAAGKEKICVFDDGILKGFALHAPCRDVDATADWEVCALYVQPEFIGTGVGRIIMESVAAEVVREGRRAIRLWVLENNIAARGFYERMGYRQDGGRRQIEAWGQDELRYCRVL
jgi:ribosomal protein S18 acetylase RimI-like enzyme